MSLQQIDVLLKQLHETDEATDLKYADMVVYKGKDREHTGPYFVKRENPITGKLLLVEPDSGDQFEADPEDVEDYLQHYKSKWKINQSKLSPKTESDANITDDPWWVANLGVGRIFIQAPDQRDARHRAESWARQRIGHFDRIEVSPSKGPNTKDPAFKDVFKFDTTGDVWIEQ